MQIKDEVTITLNIEEAKDLLLIMQPMCSLVEESITFKANCGVYERRKHIGFLNKVRVRSPTTISILELSSEHRILEIRDILFDKLRPTL